MSEVENGIEQLAALLEDGDAAAAAGLLGDLRRRWAADPASFGPEMVAALQEHGRRLDQLRLASVDTAMAETFGYPEFRPGQREIIEAGGLVRAILEPADALALLTVAIGLWPQTLFEIADRAAGELLDPDAYLAALQVVRPTP